MGIIFSNNNKKIKEQQRLIDDLESDLQILKHNLLEICVKYNELKKHIIDAPTPAVASLASTVTNYIDSPLL